MDAWQSSEAHSDRQHSAEAVQSQGDILSPSYTASVMCIGNMARNVDLLQAQGPIVIGSTGFPGVAGVCAKQHAQPVTSEVEIIYLYI